MKQKLKRAMAALLVFCMTVTVIPYSMAEARETNFFTDQEHVSIKYADMQYVHYDPTEFYQTVNEAVSLCKDVFNQQKIRELYQKMEQEFTRMLTLYTIANNSASLRVTDASLAEEVIYCYDLLVKMQDQFFNAMKEILNSPCKGAIESLIPSAVARSMKYYSSKSNTQTELETKEKKLLQEYNRKQIEAQNATVKVNGKAMNSEELITEFLEGKIDVNTYTTSYNSLTKKINKSLGEVYIRMVNLRKKLAKKYGFSNYADYRYAVYGRDYTQKSIKTFENAVKKYLVEPFYDLSQLVDTSDDVLSRAYDPKTVLAEMKKYMDNISTEATEALDFLIDNELYDLTSGDAKLSGSYTTSLPFYGSAFIFMNPEKSIFDFCTMIHEFGHFNNYYHNKQNWYDSTKLDIAEVHSQGMELLFYPYYDDIFGKDADTVREYSAYNLLYAYITGCLINELETYAYSTENLTLKGLNQKYMKLLKEYGLTQSWDTRTEAYNWVEIPHLFQSPCYYISYATSVAAAFEIWEESNKNYDKAVDKYLTFTSLGFQDTFIKTLEKAGLDNPLTAASVKKVGKLLNTYYKLDERMEERYGKAG